MKTMNQDLKEQIDFLEREKSRGSQRDDIKELRFKMDIS